MATTVPATSATSASTTGRDHTLVLLTLDDRDRAGYSGYQYYIGSISYSDSDLIKTGSSFQYTTTVTSFGTYGLYVMWVYVRRSSLSTSYSEQIYVEVGK